MLAELHSDGVGRPKDFISAHAWMNHAVTQGHESFTRKKEELPARMTFEQIAEAQGLAAGLSSRIAANESNPLPLPSTP